QRAVLQQPRARLAGRGRAQRYPASRRAARRALRVSDVPPGDILDPAFGKGHACSEFAAPLLNLGPHGSPIGIHFYRGSMFPPEYTNRLFITVKSSSNKTHKSHSRLTIGKLQAYRTPKEECFY